MKYLILLSLLVSGCTSEVSYDKKMILEMHKQKIRDVCTQWVDDKVDYLENKKAQECLKRNQDRYDDANKEAEKAMKNSNKDVQFTVYPTNLEVCQQYYYSDSNSAYAACMAVINEFQNKCDIGE